MWRAASPLPLLDCPREVIIRAAAEQLGVRVQLHSRRQEQLVGDGILVRLAEKKGGEQRNAEESRLLQVSERYQHRSKESVQARQEEAIQRERE